MGRSAPESDEDVASTQVARTALASGQAAFEYALFVYAITRRVSAWEMQPQS